jgi:hypothetical protein
MTIQQAKIVSITPTKVWAEKDVMGTVHIKRQHEGDDPFDFIQIQYDYAHTSNGHQYELAKQIMYLLGGGEWR